MSVITLRLDDQLEERLKKEMSLEKKSRSDLVRDALEAYLRQQEQSRLMQALIQEMKSLPYKAQEQSRAMAEEALPLDNEALDLAENQKPKESDERWWK